MALSAYYNGGGAPQSGSYSRVNIAGGNNSLEPAAASYNIVRTKQADAFPVFIQRATYTRDYNSQRQQQPIPPFLQSSAPQLSSPSFASHSQHQHACTPVNNHNNHARQPTDHYHNGDVKYPPKMVQQKAKQVATKYIEKPVSPGLQGDDSNGYLYTYQHSPATSPSPTNSAQETLERNIERWERYRSIRQSIHPASQSTSVYKKPQTIYDIRSVYARSTPDIVGKVSAPPKGTKQRPLDKAVYENEDIVSDLTRLLVTKMNIELEPNSYGLCTTCLRSVRYEEEGCTAQDQLYHTKCFCCGKCGKSLRGGSFYSIDGKAVCEADYMETLEKCTACRKAITERILRATGKPYHPKCFTCVVCKQCLDGVPFTVDASNNIHCIDDFHSKFAPRCSVCREAIVPDSGTEETVRIVCMDRNFHPKCYKCELCGLVLNSDDEGHGCYPLDGHILCHGCNVKRNNQVNAEILKNHI